MSNNKNLNQTNLKELVRSFSNPRLKKDIFDLTGDIILKEEEQRRRPGYRLGYDSDPEYSTNKKWYHHISGFYDELVNQAADEAIPKTALAARRLYASFKREAHKDLLKGSSSIRQGVESIEGNDINLFFLRKYFSMYSKVCYNSLVATEGQNFQRPIYTDPGIYCLDYSIDKQVRAWVKKYSKKVKNLLSEAEKKQNSKELKAEILTLIFDNFIKNMKSISTVSRNKLMISESKKINLINQLSSIKLDESAFSADYLIGSCVLLFEPVYIIYQKIQSSEEANQGLIRDVFLNEDVIKEVSVTAASDVFSGELGSANFSSFLNYVVPQDFANKVFSKNNKMKKSWYAYTANLTFDPYGERSYDDFWKKQPFKNYSPNAPGDDEDFKYYELGTTVATGLMGAWVSEKIALKTIEKLENVKKKAKKGKSPLTRGIFISSGILAAGLYTFIDPQGLFDIKKKAAVTIRTMVDEHNNAFWFYREEYKKAEESGNNSTIIDFDKMSDFEQKFEAAAQELILQLDDTMRTVVGHGMEDPQVNMVTKNQLAQTFSGLIEMVHQSFHPTVFSFAIKGKGKDDQVSTKEIYDKLTDLRDTVAALQVLERLINGSYGTNKEAKALKKAELLRLNHLTKKAYNTIHPEHMGDLFKLSDSIRLNRSIFFNTIFRSPDYEVPPKRMDELKYYPVELYLLPQETNLQLEQNAEQKTDYISQFAEQAKKIKAEIEFWEPTITKIFGSKAGKAIKEREDTDPMETTPWTHSLDIENNLKSITIPKLKILKNRTKTDSEANIQESVSEFNKWYRRSFYEEQPKLYNSEEERAAGILDKDGRLKEKLRFGILSSEYFRLQPGLKSKIGMPPNPERAKTFPHRKNYSEYLYILIGPMNYTSHTVMFFDNDFDAVNVMKEASMYSLGTSGKRIPAFRDKYEKPNIVGPIELGAKNAFHFFDDNFNTLFFQRFVKTRDLLLSLGDTYRKARTEEPKLLDLLRDNDLSILDDDEKINISGEEYIYSRFTLLNNYLESLGILVGWTHIMNRFVKKNFKKVNNIDINATALHKLSTNTDRGADFKDRINDHWSSIRSDGASIIASIDNGARFYQVLQSVFLKYQMKYSEFLDPRKWPGFGEQ